MAVIAFLGTEFFSHRLVTQREAATHQTAQLSLMQLHKTESLKPFAPLTPSLLQHMNLEIKRYSQVQLMPFVEKVGASLGDLALLKKLEWEREDHTFKSTLWIHINDRALTKQEILNTFQGIKASLTKQFPGAMVAIKRAPFGTHRKEKFSTKEDQSQDGVLEITFPQTIPGAP